MKGGNPVPGLSDRVGWGFSERPLMLSPDQLHNRRARRAARSSRNRSKSDD